MLQERGARAARGVLQRVYAFRRANGSIPPVAPTGSSFVESTGLSFNGSILPRVNGWFVLQRVYPFRRANGSSSAPADGALRSRHEVGTRAGTPRGPRCRRLRHARAESRHERIQRASGVAAAPGPRAAGWVVWQLESISSAGFPVSLSGKVISFHFLSRHVLLYFSQCHKPVA